MNTELMVFDEYLLYILYILLVIAIFSFFNILKKKRQSFNIDQNIRYNHYWSEQNILHQNQQKNLNKTILLDTKKTETDNNIYETNEHKIIITSCLPVYRDEIPEIDEVQPSFFEYFKGNKLLIVEDNKINQKILLNILKNINTPIDIADNGAQALQKIMQEKKQYELVLMDISMPVMDGINATKKIRLDSNYDHIPIVTVTAFVSGVEIGQMFDVGANAFLTKPLDIHKLFVAMLLYLDNSKSDIPIEQELDIMGIDLQEALNSMDANHEDIKETIEEFLEKYSAWEHKVPIAIDNNNLKEAKVLLDELAMILGFIGATRMQQFIEQMSIALENNDDIKNYKILFVAQYKALLNTYRKYINSI
jgi:CheY-like chemotaxis protein